MKGRNYEFHKIYFHYYSLYRLPAILGIVQLLFKNEKQPIYKRLKKVITTNYSIIFSLFSSK